MNTESSQITGIISDAAKKLAALIPEDLHTAKQELDKNIHSVLQSMLHKLDLVTREEFDAQVSVLTRTRQKLVFLEAELAELSSQIAEKQQKETD